MEVELEVELEDAEEAEELEHGLPLAAAMDMGDIVHNSFIKEFNTHQFINRFIIHL